MIYLDLFYTFFKIGLFTFGGGQAMIPLIITEVVGKGWISENALINFIAIAESTPGPFAINIATFSGVEVAGIFGAIMATLGVVLPSVVIIILIAKIFTKLMQRPNIQNTFVYVRSTITGLIASVLILLVLTMLFTMSSVFDAESMTVDIIGICMFAGLSVLSFVKIKKKKLHPVLLLFLSGFIGMFLYVYL